MLTRKLQYLIALARERHFAHAAAACHVSQPTLSAAIRQLEIEMGVRIVQRGPRFHGLTEDGERVLAFAQLMASGCQRLHEELSDRGRELVGTLRVGVIPSAMPLIPHLTTPFHRRHARVNLKIVDLNPPDVLHALKEPSVDLAITYIDDEVQRCGRTHPLYVESYAFLTKKGDLRSARKAVSWQHATRRPLCLLAPEMQHRESLPESLFGESAATLPRIETTSINALYSHVRSGAWASVLPRSLASDAEGSDDLEMMPLPRSGPSTRVGVIIHDTDHSSPLAEAFFRIAVNARIPWTRRKSKHAS